MRSIKGFIDVVAEGVRKALVDEDIKIISAYPYSLKPTVLQCAVVALGLEGVELSDESIDDSTKSGEIAVFADIFVPAREKSDKAIEIFSKMCASLSPLFLTSISADRIYYDKTMSAYVMKTVCRFNDIIAFGGEDSAG